MDLNEVLNRLQNMPTLAKPHIQWPSGELMKTDEGKEVLKELYRVCGVTPIRQDLASLEDIVWLKGVAQEWNTEIALVLEPYKKVPVNGNPDPSKEHGDKIRQSMSDFVGRLSVECAGIKADYVAFDHERFLLDVNDVVHNEHMTNRLNDFYRMAELYQPQADVYWYSDGPVPNWDYEWTKWVTSDTLFDSRAPRCYTPQWPGVISRQLHGTMRQCPYISLASGREGQPNGRTWRWNLEYDRALDRENGRIFKADDSVLAVNTYPQPGEPKTPEFWEAFFAYCEGWS